jgi:signal transduction histidine kinase
MGTEDEASLPLRRAERLETLAALARPVQHEINNLLTVIFANLEMLKRTAAEGAPQRQLDRIQEAARRFEASTRAILSLSRRPVPGVSVFAPAQAVAALRPLLLLPAPGALTLDLPGPEAAAAGGTVRMDRAALDEALLGLAAGLAAAAPPGKAGLSLSVLDHAAEKGDGGGAVELRLRVTPPEPSGAVAQALDRLRALARAAGGAVAEEEPGALTVLRLPVEPAPAG